MIIAGLSIAAWLLGTGQVASFDGLFVFCACLVVVSAFGLYVRFLIGQARKSILEEQRARGAAQVPVKSESSESRSADLTPPALALSQMRFDDVRVQLGTEPGLVGNLD